MVVYFKSLYGTAVFKRWVVKDFTKEIKSSEGGRRKLNIVVVQITWTSLSLPTPKPPHFLILFL